MASRIGLIRAVLNLDSAGFRQGLERAQSASERFQKKMRRMEYRMKRFGRKMENVGRSMTMGITAPILGAAGAAVKSAADFEALGVQMEVLTGSVEEGKKAFEDLKRFSARTPFQLKDLTKAQNTLMGFGESTEEAFEHLQMLGDVAAVTGGDLQAITVAFGQASAEGKLMTRDIRQLINQGVPAIKMLSESLGVAQSEVLDMAEAGEITFPRLVESFRQATEEGGQFANGTERLANTLKGVFSTLKDNVSIALAELGDVIAETLDLKQVGKNLSKQIQAITKRFQEMSADSQKEMLKIAALFAAGGPVLWAVGKFAQIIAATSKFIRTRFILIAGGFALGVSIGQWFIDNWEMISQKWQNFMSTMEITAKKMILGTMEAFKGFINWATQMAPPELITGIFGVDLSEMAFEASGMNKIMSNLRKDITNETDKLVDGIGKVNNMNFTSFTESAKNGFDTIKDSLSGLLDMVYGGSSLEGFINMLSQPLPDFAGGGLSKALIDSPLKDFKNPLQRAQDVGDGESFANALFGDLSGFTNNLMSIGETYDEVLDGMMAKGAKFSDVTEAATANIGGFWDKFTDNFKSVGQEFSKFIAEQMTQAITSFSETVGTMFSGADDGMRTAFEKVITIVLDFAKRLGQILIAIGSAMMFTAILSGPGGAYIAAGSALVAIGTGFNKGIEKRAQNRQQRSSMDTSMPEMAQGGLAFGPTAAIVGDNPNARSNPEVIAPLDKLKDMMGVSGKIENHLYIDGREVELALEDRKHGRNR